MPITPKNVVNAVKLKSFLYDIGALAAGADVADMPIFKFPCAAKIVAVSIIPQGDDAGIDDSNTSVWNVEVGTTAKAAKTFDATTTFPDNGATTTLTLASDSTVAKDAVLLLNITNGATADVPLCRVQVDWIPLDTAWDDV